jgi:hypothetical protein
MLWPVHFLTGYSTVANLRASTAKFHFFQLSFFFRPAAYFAHMPVDIRLSGLIHTLRKYELPKVDDFRANGICRVEKALWEFVGIENDA